MYSVVLMMGMMTTTADQKEVTPVAVKAVASTSCSGGSAMTVSGCSGGQAYAAQGYRRMPAGNGRARAVVTLPIRVLLAPFRLLGRCQ